LKNGKEKLHVLAKTKEPSNREEYDSLCTSIFDTSSKLLEMTGGYTPDISTQEKREQWKQMKYEVDNTRQWLLQNKGRLWPKT